MRQSGSPMNHSFGPRRPSFDLASALARDWHGGSAFRTAWFNALSMMLPHGERFFIDSVNEFRDKIEDPQLKSEVQAFLMQEANHMHQHQAVNKLLCEVRGYDMQAIEGPIAVTECSDETNESSCEYETNCGVRANWQRINLAVQSALSSITLADMAVPGTAELVSLARSGTEADRLRAGLE